MWDHYVGILPQVNIEKVFDLSLTQIALFSDLKLQSIETRLAGILNDSSSGKVVLKGELDVARAISKLANKLAEATLTCKDVKQHAAVESLRHELTAFQFMKIAKEQHRSLEALK